jgi:transposase
VKFWPFSGNKVREAWASLLALVNTLLLRIQDLEDSLRTSREKAEKLEQEVQDLKGRLAQNSSNSHRPPSSDNPDKPRPKSLRQSSSRKPGGQPGHPGQTLQQVKEPDHVAVHPLEICPQCRGRAVGEELAIDYETRQVFDLPKKLLEVTEHRAEVKCCPECGETVTADFPAEVTAPAQYGSRFEGLMVYLNQYQLLPCDRLCQLSEDIFGQPLSTGTVTNAPARLYEQLECFEQALAVQLPQAAVVHVDETGLRVANARYWLHVASTAKLTFYGVHAKRGTQGIDSFGILGACRGWLIHDHWKPYFSYDQCLHALCNEHLLRELKFLWEEQQQEWAHRLSDLLVSLHQQREQQGQFSARQFQQARRQYRAIVQAGRRLHPPQSGRGKQSKAANLLDRLEDFEENILAFLWHEQVPFTNNQAEQDIRMMKVRQKISGCFRTLHGARVFCRIRSYISTCRKQGLNIWCGIEMAINGRPFIPSVLTAGP